MDDTRPFGALFADAWALLQRYLSDLDQRELDALRELDRPATVALLLQQPELREDAAQACGPDVGPEELATRIVTERLRALGGDPGADANWGARFLAAWREHGGPLTSMRYAQIQALKRADRAAAKKLLAGGLSFMSYVQRKALDELEPEEFARRLMHEYILRRAAGTGGAGVFFF